MNEYRRFISYVYTYYQEKKEQNIGFLKVEKRGNHVKMQGNFRVRQRSDMGENYQLYMLVTDNNRWYRIPADCMQKKGNIIEIYLETEADNVLQSGYRVEQTAGVQIVNDGKPENQYFLASVWVNENPDWEMLLKTNEEQIEKANVKENTEGNGNYTSSIVQLLEDYVNQEELTEQSWEENEEETGKEASDLQADIKSESESALKAEVEAVPESAPEPAPEPTSEAEAELESEIKSEVKLNSMPESGAGSESGSNIKDDADPDSDLQQEKEKLEELWQNWRKLYCKCQIPYNNTVLNGIKIQLSDLERFPSNCWQFAGNPFVLHGYYYFRYIVFAKDPEGNFYIGVPGIYHDRERMVAALFGFGQFAKMPSPEGIDGEFGYWLHCI